MVTVIDTCVEMPGIQVDACPVDIDIGIRTVQLKCQVKILEGLPEFLLLTANDSPVDQYLGLIWKQFQRPGIIVFSTQIIIQAVFCISAEEIEIGCSGVLMNSVIQRMQGLQE